MRKNGKKLLSLVMVMVLAMLPTTAFAADTDFVIEDSVLKKYNGSGGDVVIPDGIIVIGDGAFWGCESLTSISMPNSVASIGRDAFQRCNNLSRVTMSDNIFFIDEGAFQNCDSLREIKLPNSLVCIRNGAFLNCRSLTSLTIPRQVLSIGESNFIGSTKTILGGCEKLSEIKVDSNNKYYTATDGVLFTKSMTSLIEYPAGKSNSTYIIPDGVTSIGSGAFEECSNLTNVIIPNSVTSIESWAFSDCSRLVHINIPRSVASIGHGVFCGCSALTSVILPESITSIGLEMFRSCTGLTNVTIPNSVTSIGDAAFVDCESLTDVYFTGTEAQWNSIEVSVGNDALKSATIHYNSTGPDQSTTPDQPSNLPTVEKIPAAGTAVARTQTVTLDGKDVQFQYYAVKDANGNESNYVKIRDLAMALNGTKAQFNVGWDGKISITSNTPYQAAGGEGSTPYSGNQPYTSVSDTPVSFNGSSVNLTSFSITYQGGGYTYYKLRDLGQLLNFNVKWDGGVVIETDKPYTGK